MTDHPLPPAETGSALRRFLNSRVNVAACIALAGLGAYLLANHVDHALAAAPYLFLIACPLLHLFMHRGHGHDK
jgi:uncharacterized protein (UPF0261 family)